MFDIRETIIISNLIRHTVTAYTRPFAAVRVIFKDKLI